MSTSANLGTSRKIKLLVSYDGTDFCGWQKQKDHAWASDLPSIQESMELGLAKIFNHPVSVSASGRTDAGVHAIGQVCDFETDREKLPQDLRWALKAHLPPSIVIKKVWQAPLEFHSTLSAEGKTYRYWLWNNACGSALLHRYTWWIRKRLDLEKLNREAACLIGTHDFKSFQSAGTLVKTTVRRIERIQFRAKNKNLVEFSITGNGFLKQMVRNIVGTLIDSEIREQSLPLHEILAAKNRQVAGQTAPPQGLYLERVKYPDFLDKLCKPL